MSGYFHVGPQEKRRTGRTWTGRNTVHHRVHWEERDEHSNPGPLPLP